MVRQNRLAASSAGSGRHQPFHRLCIQENEVRAWSAARSRLSVGSDACRR
ncbi:hypothetical protein RB2654_14425 [Rhodobacterales bacterium HTCC2654]|uniref:Uncharacterized protein n=1 Tax=Maritimibacter alkaliphilus HTCC2654 TaxID=314271 RepID=A3VGT4_9RHOB|nr:hypothetical protein RB2654_14425 [Rhodobacterales bacterium HTCC2654] [Maritimibacter alkaliphilus HTCC2654]